MSLIPLDERKRLFIDIESCGLDHNKYSLWNIAGLLEINDKIVEEFDIKLFPKKRNISNEAKQLLEIDNPLDFFSKFQSYNEGYNQLISILDKYVNRYDKNDKFILYSYNVPFDTNFLKEFFKENNDVYFGSWFSYQFDIMQKVLNLIDCEKIDLVKLYNLGNNIKLNTIAKYFELEFNNHVAISDIKVTYKIWKKLCELES